MASTTRDISKVPTEILFAIFQFLPLEGLQGVRLVCRRWRAVVDNDILLRLATLRIASVEDMQQKMDSHLVQRVGGIILNGDEVKNPLPYFTSLVPAVLELVASRHRPLRLLRIENMEARYRVQLGGEHEDTLGRAVCNAEDVSITCMLTRDQQRRVFDSIANAETVALKKLRKFWVDDTDTESDFELMFKAVTKLSQVDVELVSENLYDKIEDLGLLTSKSLNIRDVLPELVPA